MGTIGIKLKKPVFTALCAKIIRKYRDISISEIKQLVSLNNYLDTCDYVDSEGIQRILKIYIAFSDEGIQTDLYEHDKITSPDFLNNLLLTYAEISREVEIEIDNESRDS